MFVIPLFFFVINIHAQKKYEKVYPSNTEEVSPIHKIDFNNSGACPERKQGGNPQTINGYQFGALAKIIVSQAKDYMNFDDLSV
jgi:hypothetical protein